MLLFSAKLQTMISSSSQLARGDDKAPSTKERPYTYTWYLINILCAVPTVTVATTTMHTTGIFYGYFSVAFQGHFMGVPSETPMRDP